MDDRQDQTDQQSAALELLRAFDIDLNEVANHARIQPKLANAALSSCQLESCPLMVLIKVKTAAEMLLRQKGWDGDASEIWCDFYRMLSSASEP